MKCIINSIQSLPYLKGYYFFLIGSSSFVIEHPDIYKNPTNSLFNYIDEIGRRLGEDSVIIQAENYEAISSELIEQCENKHWFNEYYRNILRTSYCLLITNANPCTFDFRDNVIFKCISFRCLDEFYAEDRSNLIDEIVDLALNENRTILRHFYTNS